MHAVWSVEVARKYQGYILMCLSALFAFGVNAGTKVTERDEIVVEEIPKPAHIWVYDFSATASDIPKESELAGQSSDHDSPQTEEQVATGRKLGADIAAELVSKIKAMGLAAERPVAGTKPDINDLVIRGSLVSMVAGSEKKRFVVGFGSGESELKVAVEGFQMTAEGLRKLGYGSTESTGPKTPGEAAGVLALVATHNPIGLIVSTGIKAHEHKTGADTLEGRARDTAKEIAKVLKQRFQEQGWIEGE
jgi:hypothetical protein